MEAERLKAIQEEEEAKAAKEEGGDQKSVSNIDENKSIGNKTARSIGFKS
jgi:hypothetical protein